MASLRLHAFVPRSRANGPGLRAVVWVQGCTLGCPGCFNPDTHNPHRGASIAVADLAAHIAALAQAAPPIDGVSISGGEPLQQAPAVLALCEAVQALDLSVILWTGFAWEEVQRMPCADRLMACVDLLIAGRYDAAQHLGDQLRGSANKTLHIGARRRIDPAALTSVPRREIIIAPDGTTISSGMAPLTIPHGRRR